MGHPFVTFVFFYMSKLVVLKTALKVCSLEKVMVIIAIPEKYLKEFQYHIVPVALLKNYQNHS